MAFLQQPPRDPPAIERRHDSSEAASCSVSGSHAARFGDDPTARSDRTLWHVVYADERASDIEQQPRLCGRSKLGDRDAAQAERGSFGAPF